MTDTVLTEQDIFAGAFNDEPEPYTPETPESVMPEAEALELAPVVASDPEPVLPDPVEDDPAQADIDPSKPKPRGLVAEVISERRRRQEAEQAATAQREAAEALRREIAELRGMVQGRFQTPTGHQPAPEQKPAQAEPEPWEDLPGFVQRQIQKALSPTEQALQTQRLAMSEEIAVDKFGAETVEQAITELQSAVASDPRASADYQRIMASPLPLVAATKWYQGVQQQRQAQKVYAEIGADPAAYKAKLRDELLAELRAQAPAQAQTSAVQGRPSPVILPPSVNRASGSAGSADSSPVTETDIYAAAPRRMGRRD